MVSQSLMLTAGFRPERLVPPSAWIGHIPFAAWLMQTLRPRVFVELGTHSGNSYFSFCQARKEAGLSTRCYAIDTWKGDEHAGYYDDRVYPDVDEYNESLYSAFSRLVRLTFDDALECFADSSIDLLHIDGLHTYDAVKHDFESWLPKLSPCAVVLFHDTNVRGRGFGVWRLWEELAERYPLHLEFTHSHGLGVLQLAQGQDHLDLDWLRPGAPGRPLLIEYFSARGGHVVDQYFANQRKVEISLLQEAVIERDRRIAEVGHGLAGRDAEIASLSQLVSERDAEIARQSQMMEERDAEFARLNQMAVERDAEVARLNETAVECDAEVARLSEIVMKSGPAIGGFGENGEVLVRRDGEIADLVKAVEESQAKVRELLSSKSWRLTAPVRALRRFLSRIRHKRFDDVILKRSAIAFLRRQRTAVDSLAHEAAERAGGDGHVALAYKRGVNAEIDVAVEAIKESGLFDEAYYRLHYPDLQYVPGDMVRHYCEHGWREGRNPSRTFDTRFYLVTYDDIRNVGINPFYHYVVSGISEHRHTVPDLVERCDGHDSASSVELDTEVEAIRRSGLFDEAYYRSHYLDLQNAPGDMVRHYCEHGWREGRNPSRKFDTCFYLSTYDDICNAGMNPFYHYVVSGISEQRHALPDVADGSSGQRRVSRAQIDGEVEAIRNSGLFDEPFYRMQYPDPHHVPSDAIRHYCECGWREAKNPSDDFDTRFYLDTYNDIRNAGINPFWHYIVAGASELRDTVMDSTVPYESDIRFGLVRSDIKLLAFYESPDWETLFGRRPLFKGHLPPAVPHDEIGFYGPSEWRVLKRQAEMAKSHGLYGFCFDLVDRSSGGALAQSVELLLSHGEIDFSFCVQVSLQAEDDLVAVLGSLMRAVSDPRYIRVAERPLILITMPVAMLDAASALGQIRDRLADEGWEAPFLIGRWASNPAGSVDASQVNLFDAMLDLPGTPITGEIGDLQPLDKNGVDVVPYGLVAALGVDRSRNAKLSTCPVYHAVVLGRDNSSRMPARPLVYTRFFLRDYRCWLDAAISSARTVHPEDRRFVFVSAWNDWNEGLFLEPDRDSGFSRLNETTRALVGAIADRATPKVTVVVPNFNHAQFLPRRLESIYGQTYKNIEVILLDDRSSDQSRLILDQYAAAHPEITRTLYNEENSGSAFRQWARGIKIATGDLIWIAESDDFCDENFLEVLVRCFEDEAVLLAYAKCAFVDKYEVPMRDDFREYLSDLDCAGKWNNAYVETAHNEVRTALGIKNTIPNASGVIFKRPVDMPLLDDESWLSMVVAGDWCFYLHIIRGGRIAYSTETTNFFRRYEGSTAEGTYQKEVYFREVGMAGRTVAALYDVPVAVLDQSQRTYRTVYEDKVGGSAEQFARWYDFESILKAREMRIPNVMVSTMGFFPGGAEIFPIRLANEFKRLGLSVLLLNAGLNPRKDGIRRMLHNDVPVIETSNIEDVKKIIRDFGVEVLNTHQWHIQKYPQEVPDVFDELCGHFATLHGMIEHGDAFGVTKDQLRKADQKVTTWIYTADKNLGPFSNAGLYERSSGRFVKIPNGMRYSTIVPIPRARMNIPGDAFVLCCVSRAIPDKGWAETVLAVEHARSLSGRDIRLILVGNGPVFDEYTRVGVPDFVYLAGFSEDSVGHYAAADMGIMLTKFKSESFPLTIVDCLFAGKPYIASDVGDIRNMLTVGDEVAGAVMMLDNWEVPIDRVAQIIADFAVNRQQYLNALALVEKVASRYRIDIVASQYVGLFAASRDGDRIGGRGGHGPE